MSSRLNQYLVCLSICFSALPASGQGFQHLFPASNGNALLDSLYQHYKPGTVLDYANARDTLYAKVLAADDDTLRCIYSGHALYLDPTQDPTQYVYLNGSTLGMNTEHAYPQSKGAADGNARSDMHHLFPARIPVNEARGDVPYLDIPDNETQKWFRGAQMFLSMPAQNKDQYSESRVGAFEPRESVKGDLARAVFYFYTMYRSQADLADPNYFEIQRATLCQWNILDPADLTELTKTWRIAAYQEGKPNPFIVDCTLAQRTWCPEVSSNCILGTDAPAFANNLGVRILPNPVGLESNIQLNLPFSGNVKGTVYNTLGQEVASFDLKNTPQGALDVPLDLTGVQFVSGWVGFLEVRLEGASGVLVKTVPFYVF